MMNLKITHDLVLEEYVINGLSDNEIATKYGVCRSSITHTRKYHNIASRSTTSRLHRDHIMKILESKWKLSDMRKDDLTFRFDFLISRVVKVQVYTATASKKQGRFSFTFSPRESSDLSDEYKEKYFVQVGDKWHKNLSKMCDVVIFCGVIESKKVLYVIPSQLIPVGKQNFNIPFTDEAWAKFRNRWSVIDSIIKRKTGEPNESIANF